MTYADVESAEKELDAVRNSYLRGAGWEQTCMTPGAHWLWHKVWRDERYTANVEFAVTLQRHMELCP